MIIDFSKIAYITQVCVENFNYTPSKMSYKVRVMYDASFQKEDLYIPAKDYEHMIEIISVLLDLWNLSRQD